MTDQERELDARLHTLLTGAKVEFPTRVHPRLGRHLIPAVFLGPPLYWRTVPDYTADGNAMLTVIDKMRERGYYVRMRQWTNGQIMASFNKFGWFGIDGHGDTFPEAVALAAVAALEAENGENREA